MALKHAVLLLLVGCCLSQMSELPQTLPNDESDECHGDTECSLYMLQRAGRRAPAENETTAESATDEDDEGVEHIEGMKQKRVGYRNFDFYPYRRGI